MEIEYANGISTYRIKVYKYYIAYEQYVLVYIDYCYMYNNMIDGNNLSKLLYFQDDLPARLMNHIKLVP